MAAAAEAEKPEKLIFVPSKSVTFMPNSSKQMAEMTISNESDKTYMFKMKSTRPGMFKMRPVYGAVQPNEKTTIKLIFKGLKPGQEAPRRERFTIVTAVAPSATVNTEKVWKMQKYQEKLCEGDVGKKKFRILFFGVNDQEEDEDEKAADAKEAKEKEKDKDMDKDKGKDKDKDKDMDKDKDKDKDDKDKDKDDKDKDKDGKDKDKDKDKDKEKDEKKKVIDEVHPSKEKEKGGKSKEKVVIQKEKEIITNVIVKKEFVQAPQKKLVVMMYRDRKDEDSLSGDDDGEDISMIQPVQQAGQAPKAGKSKEKTAPPPAKSMAPTLKATTTQPSTAPKVAQPAAATKPGAPPPQRAAAKPPPGKPAPATAPKPAPPAAGAKPPAKGPSVAQKKELEKMDEDLLGGAKTCRANVQFQRSAAAKQ